MLYTVKDFPDLLLLTGFLLSFLGMALAQDFGYQQPCKEIVDLVDAPTTPSISLSPDRSAMVVLENPSLPPISEIAQPELRLAGLRINPRTNGPSRSSYFISIAFRKLTNEGTAPVIGLPENPRIRNVQWSPDSRYLAFTHTREQVIELWLVDLTTLTARKLNAPPLNSAFYDQPFVWSTDSRSLLCLTIPDDRGQFPCPAVTPAGPVVQENEGKTAPAPTYQDLLKTPHDESLFEYYMHACLMRIDLQGVVTPLAPSSMIKNYESSPDGRYILVETIHRPFSYLVPAYRFPYRVQVVDAEGRAVKTIADLPLAEEVSIQRDAVAKGPRSFGWRQDAPATLYWAEAQDDGDPMKTAEIRDKVWMLPAPFDRDPQLLCNLSMRFGSVSWSGDHLALISEWWWKTRRERVYQLEPGNPVKSPELIFDLSIEDRYLNPGDPLYVYHADGSRTLRLGKGGRTIFLKGQGASPRGDFPFLDEFDLRTKKSRRVWQCQAPYYETMLDFTGHDDEIITRRETVEEPPNYLLRNLQKGTLRSLTRFPHPTPQLAGVQKELIRYMRKDGIQLTATLYLPPGYSPASGPLPVLMWAYPQEFKSSSAASQVTGSPFRFVRITWSSPLFWLVRGFAILDDPAMPVVGEKDQEPNDTYIEQLVASAQAAVDELKRRGISDGERLAIGGHSYGAFMVANLLSHCTLFKAGIARSGAYNRTLTPFGFQAEERTLWQAPETYITMSPFMCADKITAPILLLHGEADNNQGTFPLQSERYYSALKGLGKTARLVILPCESHSYQARESVLHMLWEMDGWLEKYVKMHDR